MDLTKAITVGANLAMLHRPVKYHLSFPLFLIETNEYEATLRRDFNSLNSLLSPLLMFLSLILRFLSCGAPSTKFLLKVLLTVWNDYRGRTSLHCWLGVTLKQL